MADIRYYVVRDHDGWIIKFEDEHYGPYLSREDALGFALDAARKLGDQGEAVQVCMMGEDGRFEPKWSYRREGAPVRIGA
jgi:hypothetical protein